MPFGDTDAVPFVPTGVAETVNVCFANFAVNDKSDVTVAVYSRLSLTLFYPLYQPKKLYPVFGDAVKVTLSPEPITFADTDADPPSVGDAVADTV